MILGRKFSCAMGVHDRVLSDAGGLMGDCFLCVECGLKKYPEAFGLAVRTRPMPLNENGLYIVTDDSTYVERVAAWNAARNQDD